MSTFVDVSGEVNYQNEEGGLSRVTHKDDTRPEGRQFWQELRERFQQATGKSRQAVSWLENGRGEG